MQKLSCGPDRYESNTVRLKELSGWQKDKVLQRSKEEKKKLKVQLSIRLCCAECSLLISKLERAWDVVNYFEKVFFVGMIRG